MRAHFSVLIASVASIIYTDAAQSEALPFGECRMGYWSSNRNLDDESDISKAACFVNWRPSVDEHTRLGFNARTGVNDSAVAKGVRSRLREGFVETTTGPWTWRAGRQIIAWGRSDRINPTDSLSPRDLTLLVPEDDEQRQGINALLSRYELTDSLSVTGILSEFEPNRMPEGSLPANVIEAKKPSTVEKALKLDRSGESLDWSLSYFDGYERTPRYQVDVLGPYRFVFRSSHERKRIWGADFAWARESWTMRGEFSHEKLKQDCNGCRSLERKVDRAVLGADRNFGESANINVQLFGVSRDYDPPAKNASIQRTLDLAMDRLNSEFDSREWGVTTRVSDVFFNERLKLELSAVADFTSNSQVIRPRASYSLTDALKLQVGVDHFSGGRQSYFGVRKKNDLSFVELSLIF